MDNSQAKPRRNGYWLSLLGLLSSTSTLLCCALPALMVTLGAGATLAGIVGTVPWLVALSKYKVMTFSLSGVMLLIAGISIWFSRKAPCPLDAELARHCQRVRQMNYWIYGFAVLLWLVGFFFAFLAIHLL